MSSQNDSGSPWGSRARPGSDFADLIRKGQDRLNQIMPSGGPRGTIVVAVLALVGLGAWTAYFTVPSDSVAVVQRFGKYLKDVPPGLHFKLPLGIDVATIIPVKRQLKQEFGFGTQGATDPYQITRDAKRETQMVTGDLNAALVEWCPSSDDLRLVRRFVKGGSGSSGLEFKRPATDAASVGWRWLHA
jgi:membrane protease subunit HflK